MAAVPLKFTAVAPVKAFPVIVTEVPTVPEVGENEETVGTTPNEAALVPAPAGVLIAMGPVRALEGTVAVTWESDFTLNFADTPLKVTDVDPVNPVPLMVTFVPTGPEVGLKLVMDGGEEATATNGGLVTVEVSSASPRMLVHARALNRRICAPSPR